MTEKKNLFDIVYSLDNNLLYKYSLLYIFLFFLIIISINGFFLYLEKNIIHYSKKVDEQRKEINKLIIKKNEYEELKKKADNLILKESSFRIKDYILSIINNLHISEKVVNGGESVNEQILRNQYSELSTSFEFHNLGIEELINFIRTCEEDQRIYFKEIAITNNLDKTLSLFFVIATIQINEGSV
jgi:hypothetical protein